MLPFPAAVIPCKCSQSWDVSVVFGVLLSYFDVCCCDKHHNQKQCGKETVDLTYISSHSLSLREDRAGTLDRSLEAGAKQRLWRVLLTGLLLTACTTCFLREPRTTHSELPPHH